MCIHVYVHTRTHDNSLQPNVIHVHVPGLAEVGAVFMVILATVSLGGGRSFT